MIVLAIKQGNESQFETSYMVWHSKVYLYFYQKTRSIYMAEELVQLTFIKLWNFRHTLDEALPLEAQLFTIARTTLLDYLKKQANQQRLLKAVKEETPQQVDPSWEFDYLKRIHASLNALPPIRKQVFELNRLEGFSNREIAEKLAISIRTVEKHISLAIKQLKLLR
ncbi:MAG: polymerase ECF-type sigma factor [Pedobacter sp.]|jgi:RNA polymerase sigma factor (sigma-70 family)|nr:polymerase ECF-type sigma factor [Pedobacter sp.]